MNTSVLFGGRITGKICSDPTGYLHIGGARTALLITFMPGIMGANLFYVKKILILSGPLKIPQLAEKMMQSFRWLVLGLG